MSVDPRVLTREQIRKLRDDIKDRQPWYDDGEIDALCDLALRGIESEAGQKRSESPPGRVDSGTPALSSDLSSPEAVRGLPDLPFGESPLKQAAWDAFYATIEAELPKNPDGTHSGTFWVALMEGIQAYIIACRSLPLAPLDAQTQQAVELAKEVIDATPRDYARYKLARALLKVTGG